MKLKLFVVALVVVATAAFWVWLFHRAEHSAKPPVATTVISKPTTVAPSPLPLVVFNAVRMTTVADESAPSRQTAPNPFTTAWPDIRVIVNAEAAFRMRLNAIDQLPARLTDNGWEMLRQFLLNSGPADAGQVGQVVKNRLMDVLCEMQPPPADLSTVLTRIYQDRTQNEVLRDYAVQHLAELAEGLAQAKGREAIQAARADQEVLWEALSETDDSIAGTALLGLERLAQAGAPVDRNQIVQAALQLARDVGAGELTRITAYQACGQLHAQGALPMIEAAAQSSPTISQQISAIGALGMLGGSSDIPLLETLLQGTEERLKPAAHVALDRIASRQNQAANR